MEYNKYYVPDISEFHVGFEYEAYDGQDWLKSEITLWTDLKAIFDCEDKCAVPTRVKHLDREDIEKEGWVLETSLSNGDMIYALREGRLMVPTDSRPIQIYNPYVPIFKGTIRNISELRRIMKMVGINK